MRLVGQLRREGQSLRQIAEAICAPAKTIRQQLRRLGWPVAKVVQADLPLPANRNLSGSATTADEPAATFTPGAPPSCPDRSKPPATHRRPRSPIVIPVTAGSIVCLPSSAYSTMRRHCSAPVSEFHAPVIAQSGIIDTAREVYGSSGAF